MSLDPVLDKCVLALGHKASLLPKAFFPGFGWQVSTVSVKDSSHLPVHDITLLIIAL